MSENNKRKYVEKHPPDKQDKKVKYIEKIQKTEFTQKTQKTYKTQKHQKYHQQKVKPPKFIQKISSKDDHMCIICSQNISSRDSIWTCVCCYQYLHLKCMKQWIVNVNRQSQAKKKFIFNWSCPQCKFQYNQSMPQYYCFCGKYKYPEYDRDLPPHSCGKLCHRKRGLHCPHPCPSICHSGKCPPCQYQGIQISCSCGKSLRTIKCSEQRQIFQCGKKCQQILNCHKHKCQRNCHNGQCNPCNKKHLVKCFCGKSQDVVDCMKISFGCQEFCGKILDCGFHKCQSKCHQGQCTPCLNTPSIQKTCPCGKFQLQLLTDKIRTKCSDQITCCGSPCKRQLQCGHQCHTSCHEGKCPNCKVQISQNCRCGLTSRKIDCYTASREDFVCENVCKRKKNCGNHNCNTLCCPNRTSLQQHTCELNCQKQLNCQKHTCGQPCHLGNCKKCPVIYSQPQPCPCGSTFLKPPILCGNIVPECQNLCNKKLDCGHTCFLKCHYGICKCAEQVMVKCRCGKEQIKTLCGRQALCLTKCPNVLKCGHKCLIQCHAGSCQDVHKMYPCRQNCSKKRQICDHICNQFCHYDIKCQKIPCQVQIIIKCECGNRQTTIICGNSDKKNKKAILCNKKCQNMKRFNSLYKDKQIYYPTPMFQFGFKNFPYVQKLQERLERFIGQSQQSCLEIQFKYGNDANARTQLVNLFENHYHLNTHFYKYRQHASFTVMQTQDTMVPKPCLTEYIKQVAKGQIKRNNLPFQLSIKFEIMVKEKVQMMLSCLKQFKHRYYVQKKQKMIFLNFWDKKDGYAALNILQTSTPGIEFIPQEYIVEQQQQQTITAEQIIEKVITEDDLQKEKESSITQKPQKQKSVQRNQQSIKKQPKNQEKDIQDKSTKIIIRSKNPVFQLSPYPPSKQNIQDIYTIDEDELYHQKVNWDATINTLVSKNMGPQASEWRIRSLLMINSFYNIPHQTIAAQFQKIITLYEKQKQRAARILQIQRLDTKRVKEQMDSNGIYLSYHEPQIYAYLTLFNFWSVSKVEFKPLHILEQTLQLHHAYQLIESVESSHFDRWYQLISNSNFIIACAALPLLEELRENTISRFSKNEKIAANNLFKYLLFENEQKFISYCAGKGLTIIKQLSNSKKEEFYIRREKNQNEIQQKQPQTIPESKQSIGSFIQNFMKQKRSKSNFLQQPTQLIDNERVTRSFFAFGDFKEATPQQYMLSLVKQLKKD